MVSLDAVASAGATRLMSIMIACTTLAACGGGGGGGPGGVGSTSPAPSTGTTQGWTAGVFQPSASFRNQCASPRAGVDARGRAFPDMQGSSASEKQWLRSWTNELYLWYAEVPDRNPNGTDSVAAYFDLLKTPVRTASGNLKDQFHFTYPSAEWEALSQSGVSAGYGAQFAIATTASTRTITVALIEAGSPAVAANLMRGDRILSVDGVDVSSNNVAVLNAGLFPSNLNENHSFQVRSLDGATRGVTMRSAAITSAPVHTVATLAVPGGPVGYILFNDHIATSESALINAINVLKGQNITDLVLDIRYNGGGFLDIASELAYMIAGPTLTAGRTFEQIVFNDKHPVTNPVTRESLTPTPFHGTTQGFNTTEGVALPTLDLSRVFVLTTDGTCSASEAIINGLRGVDVRVIQIGGTTCGKPYGFYAFDNCGTTYFSIQFKGVNAKNFGDYADGFSPQNTQQARGEAVEGCAIADDFTHELGNAAERMLAVALDYRLSNQCSQPAAASTQRDAQGAVGDSTAMAPLARPAWRDMRLLRTP